MEKLLNCEQVAARYNVKKDCVWKWVREKKLNAIKTGKYYNFRLQDLEKFESENATMRKTL